MSNLKSIIKNAGVLMSGLLLLSVITFAQDKTPQLNDAQIASVAVTANQIDVHYGQLAQKKSNNKDIKKFAQTMIDDHSSIIKQAVALAKKLGVTPQKNVVTKSLLKGEKKTLKKLKAKEGDAFNKAYIDNEVAYHKAVISAVKNVLIPQTKNKKLKEVLVSVAPLLEHHLHMAEEVQKQFK